MKVFILTRKRLAVLSAALAAVVGAGVIGAARSSDAVPVNAQARSIPIYSVKTEEKKVALSFDAAWGNDQTQTLLDILKENDVHSTFFLVGDWVRSYPDDVKKISAAGHDVGNHSDTHPYMTKLDGGSIKKEITNCSDAIEKLKAKRPTLFRPPYGDYDNTVVDTVNSLGMYCVQWSIDSLDWQDPSPSEIVDKVKKNLAPGAIILMHNGAKNTPEALPEAISYIKSQGYEIVPISQLLPKGSYKTDVSGAMIPDGEQAVKTAAEAKYKNEASSETPSDRSESAPVQSMPAKTSSISTEKQKKTSSSTASYSGLAGELYMKGENTGKK